MTDAALKTRAQELPQPTADELTGYLEAVGATACPSCGCDDSEFTDEETLGLTGFALLAPDRRGRKVFGVILLICTQCANLRPFLRSAVVRWVEAQAGGSGGAAGTAEAVALPAPADASGAS